MNPKDSSQGKAASIRAKLKFQTEQAFIEKYAPNISRTGIFVRTASPRVVGTRVKFEFLIADGTPVLRGLGEVAWGRTKAAGNKPPGMGIKFLKLDTKSREIVEQIIDYKTGQGTLAGKPSLFSTAPPPPGQEIDRDTPKKDVVEESAALPEREQPPVSTEETTEPINEATPAPVKANEEAVSASKTKRKRRRRGGKASRAGNLDLETIDSMLAEIDAGPKAQKKRSSRRRGRGARKSIAPEVVTEAVSPPPSEVESGPELIAQPVPVEESVYEEPETIRDVEPFAEPEVEETAQDVEPLAEPEVEETAQDVEPVEEDVIPEIDLTGIEDDDEDDDDDDLDDILRGDNDDDDDVEEADLDDLLETEEVEDEESPFRHLSEPSLDAPHSAPVDDASAESDDGGLEISVDEALVDIETENMDGPTEVMDRVHLEDLMRPRNTEDVVEQDREPLLENVEVTEALDDIFTEVDVPRDSAAPEAAPVTLPEEAVPPGLVRPREKHEDLSVNALYESVTPAPPDADVPVPAAPQEEEDDDKKKRKKGFFKKLFS